MAAAKKSNYLYFGSSEKVNTNLPHDFDFDESDVWSSDEVVNSDGKKPTLPFIKKKSSKNGSKINQITPSSTSLPVQVPDWSRIIGNSRRNEEEEKKEDDENECLPPHEYLAKIRGSSFSVHEGIGRTLKGRDMSRVRNAVWKQIGFED